MLTEKAKEVFRKEHPLRSIFGTSIKFYRKWFEKKGYEIKFTNLNDPKNKKFDTFLIHNGVEYFNINFYDTRKKAMKESLKNANDLFNLKNN